MHELSLCQSAVELITQQLKGKNVQKVTGVWLEAGAMACIEEEALRFAFDCATQGTILSGAALYYQTLPTQAWCWDCEKSIEITNTAGICPICQGQNTNFHNDTQLKVKQVEVE